MSVFCYIRIKKIKWRVKWRSFKNKFIIAYNPHIHWHDDFSYDQLYLNPFYQKGTPKFWLMTSLPLMPSWHWTLPMLSALCFLNSKVTSHISRGPLKLTSFCFSPCSLLFPNQQSIFLNQNGICCINNFGCPHPPPGSKGEPWFPCMNGNPARAASYPHLWAPPWPFSPLKRRTPTTSNSFPLPMKMLLLIILCFNHTHKMLSLE